MDIISVTEFEQNYYDDYRAIPLQMHRRSDPKRRNKEYYKNIICAFDIETTRLDNDQTIMYVWQFQFGAVCTIMGRTWDEFLQLVNILSRPLCEGERLVCFVHNLSYEFQFLAGIYDFQPDEVFAIKSRKILKCNMMQIEFRCSYLHSNMSLAMYLDKMGAEHKKLSGEDFDYSKKRYPDTELTPEEIEYCQNDVLGLVEAITNEMQKDNDSLYSIPLTSTGYVRRDAKFAMRSVSPNYVKSMLPDYKVYTLLREAFRGGNTHANRYYTGMILDNVKSADRSSSYPDVQINCKFPVSRFVPRETISRQANAMIKSGKHCFVTRLALWGVRLRYAWWGAPYIPKDKCRNLQGAVIDNGRVLSADYLEITITDVDYRIIVDEYNFTSIRLFDTYVARYGDLPPVYKAVICEYYKRKTSLKDVEGEEIAYIKSKNKLNSIYGMSAQNPVKQSVDFVGGEFVDREQDPEKLLEDANEHAFLPYQWGVWTTALARYRLEEGIKLAGRGFVYCDTDSVKYLDDIDWSAYNHQREEDSTKTEACARDPKGVMHYMGVYEPEETYSKFITMGAKKYAYQYEDGKTHVTVAGVNKRKGGEELDAHGGLAAFREGFIFTDAGGNELVYNDNPGELYCTSDKGNTYRITRNVTIRPSTYRLGYAEEYRQLLGLLGITIDQLWRD